jgi:hypothetical protein
MATVEANGVTLGVEHFGDAEELSFGQRDDSQRLDDVVELDREAADDDGSTGAAGLNVLVLAGDGYTCVDRA